MNIRVLIDNVPIFQSFSEIQKKRIANLTYLFIRYEKDEVILKQFELDSSFYILVQGSVRVTRDDLPDKIIAKLKPGSIFGEMAYLTGKPRSTHVIAHEPETIAMKLDHNNMFLLPANVRDRIKDSLIHLLVNRINQMNDALIRRTKKDRIEKNALSDEHIDQLLMDY
ncbi:MAG: cyclic nucleotide-binding domain-containing protein [Magnetococcus sp. DMHC-6]